MRKVWGARVTMVHQDPSKAINPSITVGEQIAEVARVHLACRVRRPGIKRWRCSKSANCLILSP